MKRWFTLKNEYSDKRSNLFWSVASSIMIMALIYLGVSKLFAFQKFSHSIYAQPVLRPLRNILIWVIPFTEILLAFCFFFARYILTGFYLSMFYFLVNALYNVLVITKVLGPVPCPCGAILYNLDWRSYLVLNSGLCISSFFGIIILRQNNIKQG